MTINWIYVKSFLLLSDWWQILNASQSVWNSIYHILFAQILKRDLEDFIKTNSLEFWSWIFSFLTQRPNLTEIYFFKQIFLPLGKLKFFGVEGGWKGYCHPKKYFFLRNWKKKIILILSPSINNLFFGLTEKKLKVRNVCKDFRLFIRWVEVLVREWVPCW